MSALVRFLVVGWSKTEPPQAERCCGVGVERRLRPEAKPERNLHQREAVLTSPHATAERGLRAGARRSSTHGW